MDVSREERFNCGGVPGARAATGGRGILRSGVRRLERGKKGDGEGREAAERVRMSSFNGMPWQQERQKRLLGHGCSSRGRGWEGGGQESRAFTKNTKLTGLGRAVQ